MQRRAVLAVSVLLACSPDGDGESFPDPDVASVPEGDAVGGDFTGTYEIALTVAECIGDCVSVVNPGDPDAGEQSLCEPGDTEESTLDVEHDGGQLVIGYGGLRLVGGANRDGTFDVLVKDGGPSEPRLNLRFQGAFENDESISGRSSGRVFHDAYDCYVNAEFAGTEMN